MLNRTHAVIVVTANFKGPKLYQLFWQHYWRNYSVIKICWEIIVLWMGFKKFKFTIFLSSSSISHIKHQRVGDMIAQVGLVKWIESSFPNPKTPLIYPDDMALCVKWGARLTSYLLEDQGWVKQKRQAKEREGQWSYLNSVGRKCIGYSARVLAWQGRCRISKSLRQMTILNSIHQSLPSTSIYK